MSRAGRAVACSRREARGDAEVGDLDLAGRRVERGCCAGLRSLWMSPRPWMSATARGDPRRQPQEGRRSASACPRADRATRRESPPARGRAGPRSSTSASGSTTARPFSVRPSSYSLRSRSTSRGRLCLGSSTLRTSARPSAPLTARYTEDLGLACSRSPSTYADVAPTPLPDSSSFVFAPDPASILALSDVKSNARSWLALELAGTLVV